MKFRAFRHNYHEAALVGFVSWTGEIMIDAVLNPCFNTCEQPVRVTFSGVENADEVTAFLAALPKPGMPGAPIAEISALVYSRTGPNWFLLELSRSVISVPADIVIRAKHVYEN